MQRHRRKSGIPGGAQSVTRSEKREAGACGADTPGAGHARVGGRVWPARLHEWRARFTAAWKEYESGYARFFAAATVNYVLIALVPLLVLLLATAGLLLRFSNVGTGVEQQLLEIIGAQFGPELQSDTAQLLARLQEQSVLAAIVGFLGLVWTVAVLVGQLRMSFRAIWRYPPPIMSGSLWRVIVATLREKVIALGIVALGLAILIGALILLVMLEWLSARLPADVPLFRWTRVWLFAIPSSFILVPLSFAFLFIHLPPVRLHWREVSSAALLCGGAWLITAQALAFGALHFGSGLSSAFAGVLAVILWMNVVSKLLFFGAALCKVTHLQQPEPVARGVRA